MSSPLGECWDGSYYGSCNGPYDGSYDEPIPMVLHHDPSPQQVSHYSSLLGAVPTYLQVAAELPAPGPYLSLEPLPCMQYERGRGNRAKHQYRICFNHLVGGLISEGVRLADLLDKHSLPELVHGAGAGLPGDVAAKISIRIQFPGSETYTRQIVSRRTTSAREPISLSVLAYKIAQEMYKFMELTAKAHKPLVHRGIVLEMKDLLLCKVYRVSTGSWVPEFKVVL